MELDGLEEGEIAEIADDKNDEGEILPENEEKSTNAERHTSSFNQESGFWVKMTKAKENFAINRNSYHYCGTSGYSSPRKRNKPKNDSWQERSPQFHPLDPLGDFDPRVHSAAADWGGDVEDRPTSYARLLKSYSNVRTKVDNIIKTDKNGSLVLDDADHNVVDENSPDQKDPEQEEELNELQLRLEALQSTIEKSKDNTTMENKDTLSRRSSNDSRPKLDLYMNKSDNNLSKRKKDRSRRRKTARSNERNDPKTFRDSRSSAVVQWNRAQREKILKLADPDEQYRQFLNMVVTPRKDLENASTATASLRQIGGVPSNSFDVSASHGSAAANEDYSLKNMELDSDDESPKLSPQIAQVLTKDNPGRSLFTFPQFWNGLVPRRRPPLLPEPKAPFSNHPPFLLSAESKKVTTMQIPAQPVKTMPTSNVDASNEQQQENVATAPRSIYADCRDEEEVIILKYPSNDDDIDDTSEMIEEITPEPKQIDVVTIDEDDDETSALREILLKSLKEKKIEKSEQEKNVTTTTTKTKLEKTSTSASVSKLPPLTSFARSKSDVLVTVGGNGRRNVEVAGKQKNNKFVPNFIQSNRAPSSSPTKWNAPSFTKHDGKHLYVSTSAVSSSQTAAHRVVTNQTHTNSTNRQLNRNQSRSIRNLPFIEHKQVLIPLDDDSEDEAEANSSSVVADNTAAFDGEDALNECLRKARLKADAAKQMQIKRRQKAAMVEMLEERLKKCRDDLTNHKDSLSEDRTRLRTLESTASKRKTDLRLAEMKFQKLKEEIRNVENECASHRVFILRLNKEIQNVQSRVDRSLELQIVYEKQWKEIQELVARHRTIVERKNVKRKVSHGSPDEHTGSIKRRRRTISSTTKAASACLKRAKRKSSDGVRLCLKNQLTQIVIENVIDLNSPSDILSTLHEKSSPISDAHLFETKDSIGANENLLNDVASASDSRKRQDFFSPLICFKSYRLTKNFSFTSGLPLSSLTYCNKIQSNVQFCPFALNGKCFDSNCSWQHECDFKLSEVEAIADLLAFCPSLVNDRTDGDSIIKCAEELYSNLKEKMSLEEILEQCALNIRQKHQENGVLFDRRRWKPSQIDVVDTDLRIISASKRQHSVQSTENSDIFSNLPNDLMDTSSIRYFTPDFQKEVENSPNDVQIWLKWAIFTLNDFSTELKQRYVKTLKILCDALEKNRNDSRLWLNYLILYKFQSSSEGNENNYQKLNRKALDFAHSFELYWNLWDDCRNDDVDGNFECYEKILSFLETSSNDAASGQIFRTVLRMASVLFKNGKILDAKNVIKNFMYKNVACLDKMSFKLKSCLWSTYIYFEHFDRLPSASSMDYYISNDVTPTTEIFECDFEIPWNDVDDEKEFSRILSLFDDAFVSCSGGAVNEFENCSMDVGKRSKNVEICWILFKNRINLECKLGRFDRAVKFCDSLMDDCEKPFEDLLFISRQCRLLADCQR